MGETAARLHQRVLREGFDLILRLRGIISGPRIVEQRALLHYPLNGKLADAVRHRD